MNRSTPTLLPRPLLSGGLLFPSPHRAALWLARSSCLLVALFLMAASPGAAADPVPTVPALLDDCSDPEQPGAAAGRFMVTDESLGSHSSATHACSDGVLTVKGELVPGRGVPAFVSLAWPLSADNRPHDASAFEGVRVRLKVLRGAVAVQVASSVIDNFDYHTSAPLTPGSRDFVEVRVPFRDLRRAWSPPTELDLATITSVNLVAFGMAPASFSYEVDEIGFY